MRVSYDKLWKILIDKKMKKYQLREKAHISSNSVAKLSKDEIVSMEVLTISSLLSLATELLLMWLNSVKMKLSVWKF